MIKQLYMIVQRKRVMPYRKVQPVEELRPFVESIWVQEDFRDASLEVFEPTIVLPSTRIDLIFYFRDPFVHLENNEKIPAPRFFLFGQRTKPLKVAATGQTGIIIFSFYPWGAAPFFDTPMYLFKDDPIELSSFMNPGSIRTIEEQVLEAREIPQRVSLLQNFLLKKLKGHSHDPLVMQSTFEINNSKGNIEIEKLSRIYSLSRRHFVRRFQDCVGVSPKKFATIVRFQKALYFQRIGLSWTRIADECGYYDQPHFIREMKSYSGFSPQQLLARRPQTKLMRHFNPADNVSHFYNTIYL